MKSKLKVIIPIIIFLIILGILLINFNKKTNIELKEDIFVYELGTDITSDVTNYLNEPDLIKDLKEFIVSSDDLILKDNIFIKRDLDLVPVGKYNFNIQYKDKTKEFVIEVVDTTKPEFNSLKSIIELEETKENINLTEYFEATDLSNVTLAIEGKYNLSEAGEYKLKIIATDESNNIASEDFVLKVNKKIEVVANPSNDKKDSTNKNNVNANKDTNSNNNNNSSNNSNTQNTPSNRYRKDISNSYVNQVNAYRVANGLSALPVTSEAQIEADRRAKELVNNYSHDGAGYGFGEVIGNGTAGVDFITAWKNSPSHNATLLREENTAIAASVYEVDNHWYTVISFKMNY